MASVLDNVLQTQRGKSAYHLVFGYNRNQSKIYSLYLPNDIIIMCLKYFFERKLIFMNGLNILSRDWKKMYKQKIIEVDFDRFNSRHPGFDVYKVKFMNIHHNKNEEYRMEFVDEHGTFDVKLSKIKIKLEDLGTNIIQHKSNTETYKAIAS